MKLKKYDDNLRTKHNKEILGIDEAGRGPLAGPLVVAGVILPKDFNNEEINDSKKLIHIKREELFDIINKEAKVVEVVIVGPKEIDEVNILQATVNSNNTIASKHSSSFIVSDYIKLDDKYDFIKETKADQKSLSVAAASIIAKVTRDRIMMDLDLKYPEYSFKNHKGYGTKKHIEAIKKHGQLEIHRKSFKVKI
jgi:ribonuclease HII